ncbi:MAG: hypothetical protein WBG54_05340 [Acidobacteriaceae bacterium]
MFDSLVKIESKTLVGISVSALALLVLACCSVFGLMLFGMDFAGTLLADQPNNIEWTAGAGLIACCACVFCFLTFRAWRALYEERRWALWIARAWAALILLFGALDLDRLYRPHIPAADEYFGIVCDPVLIFGGILWLLYLWLPRVKGRFRTNQTPRVSWAPQETQSPVLQARVERICISLSSTEPTRMPTSPQVSKKQNTLSSFYEKSRTCPEESA